MAIWTFRCYDDGQGPPNLWQRWYSDHPEVQGKHDSMFDIIEQQPQWTNEKWTKTLPGNVVEVLLKAKIQWRVMGYYGEKQREFVVTAIGYHKGRVYTPKGLMGLAAIRRREVINGYAQAPVCKRFR